MQFKNIHKQYGTRFSLEIPNLILSENETIALLGANGSGKSTLLKILSGVLSNDGEKIKMQNLGYLPQQSYAFDKTVLQNVEMALYDVPKQDRKGKALKALEDTNLVHLQGERATHLSGGETQRLALSRVLARNPKILLLDEPTASCDLESAKAIENALEKYQGTLLFSTHAPAQALRLSNSVLFLEHGKILEYGETKEVLMHTQNAHIQEYMQQWKVDLDCCK